jgi:GT2 family glycosyltransferase
MPTHDTERRLLEEAIDSVCSQTYPDWELRIVDDCSTDGRVREAIDRAARAEERVKPLFLEENLGISAATNRALEQCEGELVAFLDHDDVLAPEALLRVVREFGDRPGADILYTDQDKLTAEGAHRDPFLKPDWSPVHALGVMYVGHLLAVRRALIEEVGGLDPAFDGVQDFELLLRLSERAREVRHVPEVLYHWRAIPGSVAAGEDEKPGIGELQASAVTAHLKRRRIPARAEPNPIHPHRARLVPDPAWEPPPVSVVSDGGSLHRAGTYNLGAKSATGELLLFVSETIEPPENDWIRQLALLATMPGAGPVGPLIARPDGRVAQAGVVIGLADPVAPAMEGLDPGADGHYGALCCPREVSALSGECMMVNRELFDALDGFEEGYRSGFEDFDFCQRAIRAGRAPIYTPSATVISHQAPHDARARFDVIDRALFVDLHWDELREGDRFYNHGFKRDRASFEPAAGVA